MSVAVENARLFNETARLLEETEQRATELQTVNRISKALVSQLEFDALIDLVGEQMKETFKADIVYVALHDLDSNMLNFPYYFGDKPHTRPFGNGITEKIILNKEPLLINQNLDEAYHKMKAEKKGEMVESYLGVPIMAGGKSIGVISVQSKEQKNRFDENDMRLLTTIAANVGVAMQNAESYQKMREALNELKAAQEQLVQQEKLASLGQLTAGIAHEIKNPLNFVNNFSDLSIELVDEVREELDKISAQNEEVEFILGDIEANLRKIHEHGSRADGIVKSMLQHSRGGSGEREPTHLNDLIKEYANLAFHGMRAGKNPINVDIDLDLDESLKPIPLIAEDFSRVILNLCNNAFDAMRDKLNAGNDDGSWLPKLTVRTRQNHNYVTVEVEDNGPGIPKEIKDRILQPFFTTKKGTEGTGLGLSITNDIIKSHGGEINIESESGAYTRFKLTIPNQP
jgi:signal transduction histidine kinase